MKKHYKDVLSQLLSFCVLSAGLAFAGKADAQSQTASPAVSPQTDAGNLDAKQYDAWFGNYRFRDGEVLEKLRLHYATLGTPHRNAKGEVDNAVLVLHWTNASGSALLTPEFKKALYDRGRPLDADRYFLIFPDNVGHGNSSKPSDGLRMKFPHYRYGDFVDLQHRLVTEVLGIKRLHAILGVSMGGMSAWQWAESYPKTVAGVMPVVSLPIKVSGRNLLWRRMVIDSIRSDPEWNGGNYTKAPRGWILGREILWMMINGVPRFQATIEDASAADQFIAEARRQGEQSDANDALYSLESSADYDPEPGLSAITAKVFALNFSDDEFNPAPLHILEHLMPLVRHGTFVVQPGSENSFGHLTMAHPSLWAEHVGAFMLGLDEEQKQSSGGAAQAK